MSKFEKKMKRLMNFHSEEINKIRDQNLIRKKNREDVLQEERRKFFLIRNEIDAFIEMIKKKHIKGLNRIEVFEDRKLIIEHESVDDYFGPIIERYFMYGSENKEQQYGVYIKTTTINDDGSLMGSKDSKNKNIIFKNKDQLLNHLYNTIEAIIEKDIEDRDK